jgi:hypothetical protein
MDFPRGWTIVMWNPIIQQPPQRICGAQGCALQQARRFCAIPAAGKALWASTRCLVLLAERMCGAQDRARSARNPTPGAGNRGIDCTTHTHRIRLQAPTILQEDFLQILPETPVKNARWWQMLLLRRGPVEQIGGRLQTNAVYPGFSFIPPAALLLPAVTRLGRPLAPQSHHRGLSNATGARGGASGREALACKGKARGAGASCSPHANPLANPWG